MPTIHDEFPGLFHLSLPKLADGIEWSKEEDGNGIVLKFFDFKLEYTRRLCSWTVVVDVHCSVRSPDGVGWEPPACLLYNYDPEPAIEKFWDACRDVVWDRKNKRVREDTVRIMNALRKMAETGRT